MFRHGVGLDPLSIVLFIAITKIPIKNFLEKEGLTPTHNSRAQSIVVLQPWLPGHEAAGHMTPAIVEQTDGHAALRSLILSIQSGTVAHGWCCLHSG